MSGPFVPVCASTVLRMQRQESAAAPSGKAAHYEQEVPQAVGAQGRGVWIGGSAVSPACGIPEVGGGRGRGVLSCWTFRPVLTQKGGGRDN